MSASIATRIASIGGILRTNEDAFVLFTFAGRTLPERDGKRRQLLALLFETDEERYSWLNDAVCVLEGIISPVTGEMQARIYECIADME